MRGRLRVVRRRLEATSRAGDASELLGRIRLLFFLFALLNLALIAPAVVSEGHPRVWVGAVMLGALAVLWSTVLRTGRFLALGRVLEPVLLFVLAVSLPDVDAILGVYYVGLYFGALYGGMAVTVARGAGYFAAYAGASAAVVGPQAVTSPLVIGQAWGAVLTAAVMHLLTQAVQRQAASEQAKDEFLSVVSHELRTPLTSMLGFLQTLQRHHDDLGSERARHLLARAVANAERQRELIDEMLDVSRVIEGSLAPRMGEVVLADAISDTIRLMGPDDVTHEVDPDHVAEADEAHVRRILANLLSNAEKYGAPPVVVSTASADDGAVVVRVRDHGIGVRPGFRSRLFERFSQGSTGDRRDARGVGLGLWIARELARANGGDLHYDPEVEDGACFVATFRSTDRRIRLDESLGVSHP